MEPNLVLASASPRRQELLTLAGVQFCVLPTHAEAPPAGGESPQDFVLRTARLKAMWAIEQHTSNSWVLAADTIVVVDGQILGKPQDDQDAASMLHRLSGREHDVYTGVFLTDNRSTHPEQFVSKTAVWFHALSEEWIEGYLRTKEPMDKAGAYAIQGKAAMMVSSINGSYTNVMGLPLAQTLQLLEKTGLWRPFHEGEPAQGGA